MKKIYALFVMLCLVLSATAMPLEGVVKRAVQNGEDVIVLTHEEDGTAHIYRVVDGEAVAENTLTITLVADATLYTLEVVLEEKPNYMLIEDEITNLVFDSESMALIGGPSKMWQVEVKPVKMIKNGQLIIKKGDAQYNAQGATVK